MVAALWAGAPRGVVAACSVLGAVLGVARSWGDRPIGVVLGFGAGALISSVSFELVEEGFRTAGGLDPVAIICALATVGGYAISGLVLGFAVAAGLSAVG